MFFSLDNYWAFILIVAVLYYIVSNFVQNNVGGKGRLAKLKQEMKETQLKLIEAGKQKDSSQSELIMSEYWKQTGELMTLQFKMLGVLLVLLIGLMWIFPYFEPGMEDDIKAALYDDGLEEHCDYAPNDGIYSNCFAIGKEAKAGAWTAHAILSKANNEIVAKNGTEIYVEGGVPEDVWVQTITRGGIIDKIVGNKEYHLNVTAEPKRAMRGQTVALRAKPDAKLEPGMHIEAVLDSGTFYYLDLPFAIPLINIRRIIGSYGVFIFAVFLISIAYNMTKAIYAKAKAKT